MARKILLVDDSSTMLLMEQMILSGGGYQLVTARDGEAAVHAALAHAPDLILLDAILPGMDGFEVCRRLRANERTRETPIILVVPRGGAAEHVEKGFESGCSDCVTKPLNGVDLLSKIKILMGD